MANRSMIQSVVYVILLGTIFSTTLAYLFAMWESEDYNYCYLIVPLAAYLIWEKWDEFSKRRAEPAWIGLLPLLMGILFFCLGELGGEYTIQFIAAWLILSGLLWMHLGWQKLRIIGFPVLFLLAMFPLPGFIHNNLTLKLKLWSSKIAVWIMQVYGLSVYREGNVIDLGFTQLQVVDACSGLRYLFPLLIMAILLAYMSETSFWKKIVLPLSAVPLTILTNSLRIALTGILSEFWGPKVAEGFFHGFSGWFIFIFGLVILLLEMVAMQRLWPEGKRSKGLFGFRPYKSSAKVRCSGANQVQLPGLPENEPGRIDSGRRPSGLPRVLRPFQFIVAVLLIAGTMGFTKNITYHEKTTLRQPFATFPTVIGEWNGKRTKMDAAYQKVLYFNDYVIIDYKNGENKNINFYTAYYASQRKGESIHSPASCLPGGGWIFKESGRVNIPNAGLEQGQLRVNRALIQKGDHTLLSYFWFPMRGRIATNMWEIKLFNMWDAMTRQRTDGALVRLYTPLYGGETPEEAESRLQTFLGAVTPVLDRYLPK